MSGLSGQGKDVDREILLAMDDKDLLNTCNSNNRYLFTTVCDDEFFHRVMQQRYPNIPKLQNWKYTYLNTVKWVSLLQEEYDYTYTSENLLDNPQKQYEIIDEFYETRPHFLLPVSARDGQLSLVKYLFQEDHPQGLYALKLAAMQGHLDIVKYLVEHGVVDNGVALRAAVKNGHSEVAEYLKI